MENFETTQNETGTPPQQQTRAAESGGNASAAPGTALRLKVVGVGGAATRTVARLCRKRAVAAEFVAVDTCAPELDALKASGVRTLLVGESVTGGSGAGTDATRGAKAAKASEEQLREMLAGTDLLVLVASLGRGTGSGSSVEIVNIAREIGLTSVCFATTPFSWEGTSSTEQASVAIDALQANSNAFILIENNLIAQTDASGGNISEGFRISDRWIETGVSACCRMLLNDTGRMRVDLAAFRSLFPVVGMRTLFSVGFGAGESAQEDALTELFRSPLLKTRTSVAGTAETLAIHVEFGAEPQIAFVSEIAQRVKDRFGGESRTLPSYAVNPALGDRLELCVFGASGMRAASRVVRPAPKKSAPAEKRLESDVLILSPDTDEITDDSASGELGIGDRRGIFESTRSRIFEGLDLDTPTYIRHQINLEKALAKKKKELGAGGKN